MSMLFIGKRIGKLTIINRIHRKDVRHNPKDYWECKCDCGATVIKRGDALRSNAYNSCPKCYKQFKQSKKSIEQNKPSHKISIKQALKNNFNANKDSAIEALLLVTIIELYPYIERLYKDRPEDWLVRTFRTIHNFLNCYEVNQK